MTNKNLTFIYKILNFKPLKPFKLDAMKSLIILIFISSGIIISQVAFSQGGYPRGNKNRTLGTPVGSQPSGESMPDNTGAASPAMNTPYLGEECSMYLEPDWSQGTITLKDQTVYHEIPMRYNIYNQQIEFVMEGDTAAIAEPETLESINFQNRKFIYCEFNCHNKQQTGFLEVLVEGEMRLMAYRCIRYVYINDQPLEANAEDKTFYMEKTYFYAYPGENAIIFPEKKKDILRLISGNEPFMKSYLKSTHNKLKSEQELINAFNYYNSRI